MGAAGKVRRSGRLTSGQRPRSRARVRRSSPLQSTASAACGAMEGGAAVEAEGAAGLRGCSGALAGGSRWVPEALPPRVSFPADAGLPAPGPGSLPRPGVAGPVARRCPPWEPTRGSRSWRSAWGWLVLKQEAFLRHLPFLRLFGLVLGPCQTVSRPEVFRVGISQSGET